VLEAGGRVRGIKGLHAKLYLFGSSRVIVTSANLTRAALDRNPEFGIVSQESTSIATCRAYFDNLWKRGRTDLSLGQLDDWDETVTRSRASAKPVSRGVALGDFGADAGITTSSPIVLPVNVADARQAFVKFLGESDNRVSSACETIEEIDRAGCHWAVAYPASKRPSGVQDDAVIFIGRLTKDPNDIRVFGRAIGIKHKPGRDDATADDIARRPWKAKWPRYIRVHHAEFVAGTMLNGVSLNDLMDALGANSFVPTQRNVTRGAGNTDPRGAYRQQPGVELSTQGLAWLNDNLQAAFDEHGKVAQDTLDKFDWPAVP
jgi:hypothetical protein